jgi:creatinine amidohydrolase
MEHKGTLTLRKETFLAVVFDICDSLRMHGVKHVLILNGHGGNLPPLKEALPGFREKLKIDIAAHAYWEAYTPEVVEKYLESGDVPGHAGELETSFAMAAFPERLHEEFHHPVTPEEERNYKEAKLATAAKGEALISIAVNWTADRVRRMLAGAA